jgi:hypothetical protein
LNCGRTEERWIHQEGCGFKFFLEKIVGKMPGIVLFLIIFLFFPIINLQAESFRAIVEGNIEVTPENPAGSSLSVGINSSVLISLGPEARFLRGIEIEITAPQAWLRYSGSLVMATYNNISPNSAIGTVDITGNQIAFDPMPARLRIIYQIPVSQTHGLRTTTSVTVPQSIAMPSAFPLLFRLMPVVKGLSDELENMTFNMTVRPITSNEGAVRLVPRYPPQLRNRPFTVLINDTVISDISEQIVLREGEHHLVILSDDYRNESRRFIVERTKVIELIIELQDPTPIIIFEGPQNSQFFIDNVRIFQIRSPVLVEPGMREVKIIMGDYTVTRTLNVQRGKTYRIALDVDINIREEN